MPLFLHELQHAIVTAPSGARPVPVSGLASDEMRAVPVLCELVGDGGLTLQVSSFELGKFEFQGVKVSRLLLRVVLPEGFKLVCEKPIDLQNPPPIAGDFLAPLDSFPVEWTQRTDGVIPELAGTDPAVLRANTDRPAGSTASGNGAGVRVPNVGDARP